MSKPMRPRGLAGQGAGVYKPEAIRVNTVFMLSQGRSLITTPTGHCGISERHGLAGRRGFCPRK